jgi:acetyl esterase
VARERADGATLDPDIAREMPPPDALPLRSLTLEEMRLEVEGEMLRTQGGVMPMTTEEVTIPAPSPIPATVYRPSKASGASPALLFVHGGGWVVGSRSSHDPLCRALAREASMAVISIDYRRAPEAPFPAALDDVVTAMRWLFDEGPRLRLDPKRIGIAGDSAGGNLAAVAARKARDTGLTLRSQLLIYPATSARCDTRSYVDCGEGFGLTAADMRWFWAQYLGAGGDADDPDASPLLADDLTDLPPADVITAEHDVLRDEGEAYANRLAAAGVPTVRLRALGMPHAFLNFIGLSGAARALLGIIAARCADRLS